MPRLHDVRLSLVQRAPAVDPSLLRQRRDALLVDRLPAFVGLLVPHEESARRGPVDLGQCKREGRQVVVEDVPQAREQVDEERGDVWNPVWNPGQVSLLAPHQALKRTLRMRSVRCGSTLPMLLPGPTARS